MVIVRGILTFRDNKGYLTNATKDTRKLLAIKLKPKHDGIYKPDDVGAIIEENLLRLGDYSLKASLYNSFNRIYIM